MDLTLFFILAVLLGQEGEFLFLAISNRAILPPILLDEKQI